MTAHLGAGLVALGYKIGPEPFFDTLRITTSAKWSAHELAQDAVARGINLRVIDADTVGISLDETTTAADLDALLEIFGKGEETIRTRAACCADARADGPHTSAAPALTSRIPSSTRTTPRRKCCATSAGSNRAIFRSAPR